MESLFENKTKYSKVLYDEYIKFHSRKYGVQEILFYAVTIILLIVFSVKEFNVLKWKILMIWVFIFVIILGYILNIMKSKKQYKGVVKRSSDYVIYKFYERYFETTYKGDTSKVYYIEIKKTFELEDRYYFYLDRSHACILMKNSFTKGTEAEFKDFLLNKAKVKVKRQWQG